MGLATVSVMADRSILALVRAHLVNPIVRALLYSRAHPLLSHSLLLLEYTGRRTGNRHVVPVGYATDSAGDNLLVVVGQHATKTWWRNFGAVPQPVTVQLGGHPQRASARILMDGTDEHASALRAYRARLQRASVESVAPVLALKLVGQHEDRLAVSSTPEFVRRAEGGGPTSGLSLEEWEAAARAIAKNSDPKPYLANLHRLPDYFAGQVNGLRSFIRDPERLRAALDGLASPKASALNIGRYLHQRGARA